MENPWKKIKGPNFYTIEDKKTIEAFNAKQKNDEFKIDLELFPEPYMGDPKANITLLFTNPGKKGNEKDNYKKFKRFEDALLKNLTHDNEEYPYYYLHEDLKESDGGKWLRTRMKDLIDGKEENAKLISESIFTLQLHPFHSKKFKDFNFKNPLSVDAYTMSLFKKAVEKAKNGGGIIICIRSYDDWNRRFKREFDTNEDLQEYLGNNFIKLKTPNTDKTPRTPYFKESFFKVADFILFKKMLFK